MKKIIFVLICIVFSLSACGSVENNSSCFTESTHKEDIQQNSAPMNVSSEYIFSNNGEVFNFFSTLDKLIEKQEFYEVYSNVDYTGYYYIIHDKKGSIVDYGYYDYHGIKFEQNGDILKLRFNLGGNIGNEKYYNVSNGKVSRTYECVLDSSGELVAYFSNSFEDPKQTSIVIENMFDSTVYCKEFLRDISVNSIIQSSVIEAEFIENNSKFIITYKTASNEEKVTEILTLK